MTTLAAQIRSFDQLLVPTDGNAAERTDWITRTRAADLPFLHALTTGLERDRTAIDAAVTLPWHNSRLAQRSTPTKSLEERAFRHTRSPT
ncbi:hypothetical protein [Streptomyces adustus]